MSLQAPYDTLQLVATPRSALGTPLVGAPAPTFFTTDSSVRVSPTGLLTARAVRSNVKVIATLTYQGVRKADTAVITVTDPSIVQPHPAAALVLQPLTPGDTALPAPTFAANIFYGAQPFKRLSVQVLDSNDVPIPQALSAFSTSALPGLTSFDKSVTINGSVKLTFDAQQTRAGVVHVYADATVYGVTVADTLTLTVTNPVLEMISVLKGQTGYVAAPLEAPLVVGGSVWWWNTTGDSLDVVFDDPSAAVADPVFPTGDGDGNIAPFVGCSGFFECDNIRTRQFLQAGTFPWHSPKTGLSGTIVVR